LAKQPCILLFDGECNLCHHAVQFVIPRDPHGNIRFTSLQSAAGQQLLRQYGLSADKLDTVVLIETNRAYTKSAAALRVARRLRLPWPLLYPLILLPRFMRDPFYEWVARNRYRWFGRAEHCMIPTPDMKARFLDNEA